MLPNRSGAPEPRTLDNVTPYDVGRENALLAVGG
jgi:hypothetical protein